jgi:protein-S-isoprenylcysteine O-methyltransferase Ste14
MHHPVLLVIGGVLLVAIAFAGFYYGGRWLLDEWDARLAERDARVSAEKLRRYSMMQFRGTKASEWQK